MNEQRYRAVIAWFNARPAAKTAAYLISRGAVAAVYLLYIGLLAVLAVRHDPLGFAASGVPAAAFLVGTAVRAAIDRPRPYITLGYTPLFPKKDTGCSMPSRHCFSAAAIAVTAWGCSAPLGAGLAVLAVVIALSRVLTGVHYISDVAAGLAFGSGFALIGWQIALAVLRLCGL